MKHEHLKRHLRNLIGKWRRRANAWNVSFVTLHAGNMTLTNLFDTKFLVFQFRLTNSCHPILVTQDVLYQSMKESVRILRHNSHIGNTLVSPKQRNKRHAGQVALTAQGYLLGVRRVFRRYLSSWSSLQEWSLRKSFVKTAIPLK